MDSNERDAVINSRKWDIIREVELKKRFIICGGVAVEKYMLSSALRESLGHMLDNNEYSYITDYAIELDDMRLEHGSDDAELYGKMLNLFDVKVGDIDVESIACNTVDCPCYIELDGSDFGCHHCSAPSCEECCEIWKDDTFFGAVCDNCGMDTKTAMDEMRVAIRSRSS